ncbi:TolC family protein [Granulicella arctica]|uniref:Cobalt-zinc-cadmium efflux system outer membrane protein n=1 Tax=Granulicella arctica TaxID=940613 RepID=A0A7Y9PJD3_9BACT|nr:TolC family protein [Granulicella arctica]NYF80977.1 cobalt-zinc-cadmium efflux system outer membrane protein [Granulicella arctica]
MSVLGSLLALPGSILSFAQQVPTNTASQTTAQTTTLTQPLSWQQIQDRFQQSNPTLRAGEIGIDESRAQEITAHLRPNPTFNAQVDQLTLFHSNPYEPVSNAYPNITFNYLHERDRKRELRTDSAKQATLIATSSQADLVRTLSYALRSAFVQVLQSKAILALTKENLDYYDHVLQVSSDRLNAGDIAQVDYDRLVLGRVQYESDYEAADVNLRTSKIQLLQLINDRTPVDQFDVVGPFAYSDDLQPLDTYHQTALSVRPDLQAAMQTIEKARIDHRLAVVNGSTDPTFGVDAAHQPNPLNSYIGVSVNIPLRIFDRNQGEKQRTLLDIDLQQRQADAARAQVFADVDSAYATVESQLRLLRPYKNKYLNLALSARDTISFSYQHGGASLLDFLQAENDYRGIQLGYLNLVGSYLTAAAQMNQAVGREVLQ